MLPDAVLPLPLFVPAITSLDPNWTAGAASWLITADGSFTLNYKADPSMRLNYTYLPQFNIAQNPPLGRIAAREAA